MSKYGTDKLQDALDLIGEEVFVIDTYSREFPVVKTVHISSVEVWKASVSLKTFNDGSFSAESIGKTVFQNRDEADVAFNAFYSGEELKFKEMKDCPVCGGKPTMRQFGNKFKIECAQCGLQTKPDWKLTKAINLWNERKGD